MTSGHANEQMINMWKKNVRKKDFMMYRYYLALCRLFRVKSLSSSPVANCLTLTI